MSEIVTVALRAASPGTLPPPSPSTVAAVALPLGGLVNADHDFADDPAAHSVRAWVSATPLDDPTELWWQLAAAFGETGLWPLVVTTPADESTPGRPWSTGELGDPQEPAGDAEEFFADADSDRYPDGFPGLASPQREPADTVELPRIELPRAQLMLVPTTRPADVVGRLGWLGAINHHEAGDLTAVLRSWEDRFGTVPVLLGFDTLGTLSEAVPAAGDDLDRLVAEHYAFCPDNVDQGSDDLAAYAASISGSRSWMFWWD